MGVTYKLGALAGILALQDLWSSCKPLPGCCMLLYVFLKQIRHLYYRMKKLEVSPGSEGYECGQDSKAASKGM